MKILKWGIFGLWCGDSFIPVINTAQRDARRHDDLTPFPDENGKVTLPCAVPKKEGK